MPLNRSWPRGHPPIFYSRRTTLMLSAKCSGTTGSERIVQKIIDSCPDVINLHDRWGWSALMFSALYSRRKSTEKTVEMLIKAGADVNFRTCMESCLGYTALMFSAEYSNTASTENTVRTLIDNGADLNIQNANGRTALMLSAMYVGVTSTVDTVRMLIEAGADTKIKDGNGNTALMLYLEYCKTFDIHVVQLLL